MNSILQPINLLKNNHVFCIKYNIYEGCSICTTPISNTEYLDPCIPITLKNFLNKENLTNILQSRLQNSQSTCPKCGYDENKIIINPFTYFKIFSKIEIPLIIFISFEFIDESEKNIQSEEDEQIKIFNSRIQHNKDIINYLLLDKEIFGIKYSLIGTINTPSVDHYNALILNLKTNYKKLELNKIYSHNEIFLFL